ncbi:PilZ domain-containing protein [Actinotalea sp. M2MS4P-6]|uniref:PilZ domain-containing protein n=1 Tax=Actinotalea sp. M2MS4P-6 TaxID=2983762 RepID=UPI0021E4A396|nr:PilZ domain-containing protein [Actinotalea sp. M2MS4P-6]MCV2394637.1 PilZ domain-containing protein [Actinotalea sp. M2MS4P-6]
MALEADPCQLRTLAGELIARGFVRSHEHDVLVVDAQTLAGAWFAEGDEAVVEVLNPDRGALTYHGTVEFAAGKRVEISGLRLQEVRQQRSALRVPTDLTVTVLGPMPEPAPDDDNPPSAPWDAALVDLSAHGLRIVTPAGLDRGSRWRVRLAAPRRPLELVVEVVRSHELRGQTAYGCRIVDATEREHDELFSWVLDLQRKLLARRAPMR